MLEFLKLFADIVLVPYRAVSYKRKNVHDNAFAFMAQVSWYEISYKIEEVLSRGYLS